MVPLVTVASYDVGKATSSPLSGRAASVLDKLCHVKRVSNTCTLLLPFCLQHLILSCSSIIFSAVSF